MAAWRAGQRGQSAGGSPARCTGQSEFAGVVSGGAAAVDSGPADCAAFISRAHADGSIFAGVRAAAAADILAQRMAGSRGGYGGLGRTVADPERDDVAGGCG